MTSFDDRKKGQEEKFRHDQELVFKVHARRNRLFGVWAAGKMGISGAEMDAYAKDVVAADPAFWSPRPMKPVKPTEAKATKPKQP